MKAKELAELLMQHPEDDVFVEGRDYYGCFVNCRVEEDLTFRIVSDGIFVIVLE